MSELTKWPRLLVAGDPVTREQANDILIRTNSRYLDGNDQAWMVQVAAVYGFALDHHGFMDWQPANTAFDALGVLDLGHLANEQVTSTWVGGPHGWCDWDGRIGCNTYNIGQYPTRTQVQDDLDAIAATWPFLRMDVQVVADEGDGDLLAMWQVDAGTAVLVEPGPRLPANEIDEATLVNRFFTIGAERGVTPDRLREAIAQVRHTRPAQAEGAT